MMRGSLPSPTSPASYLFIFFWNFYLCQIFFLFTCAIGGIVTSSIDNVLTKFYTFLCGHFEFC